MASGPDAHIYEKLREASQLRRAGELDAAKVAYGEILRAAPDNLEALHMSGVIASQTGDLEQASALLSAAVKIGASEAAVLVDYAIVLQALNRPEEAIAIYNRVLSIAPERGDVLAARGVMLHGLNRLDEALASYDMALARDPQNADIHYNRGLAQRALGRLSDSLASFNRAIARRPDFVDAHTARGATLLDLKRADEAVASYDMALALTPMDAEAWFNKGAALGIAGRREQALASFNRAIARRPDFVDAHTARGATLLDLKRADEAVASYDMALALTPMDAEAWFNKGAALGIAGRREQALASYDAAIAIAPLHVKAQNNRAWILKDLGRDDEAIAGIERVLASAPDNAEANWNKAIFCLRRGDFREGWRLYEWRKRLGTVPTSAMDFGKPAWNGEANIAGKSIIVHYEQGLGDTIHFCRYLPLLERLGANVTFLAQPRLTRLLRSLDMRGKVVGAATDPSAFDFQAALMSLPLAFKTDLSSIPADVPYLHADDAQLGKWSQTIAGGGIKVGVCWQAGVGKGTRSFAPEDLSEIAKIPGLRLISLQKEGAEDLMHLPAGLKIERLGEPFDAGPDAFLDSAAVMNLCDLVITTDTSIAHLAGALGVPTWVVLRQNADWRWLRDRSDSPWYPTMRLFRQRSAGDWTPVFREMREALSERFG